MLKILLREKRLAIQEEYAKLERSREELREAYLRLLSNLSPEEILDILQEDNGAVPQEPVQHVILLGDAFTTQVEMKNWAAEELSKKVVIAVDGSQILTTGEFTIPLGFVQAGAFWTEYTPEKGLYGKDFRSDIFVGSTATEEREQSEPLHEMGVNMRRLAKEIDLALETIEKFRKRGVKAYLLLDGSIIFRFLNHASEEVKQAMCGDLVRLLHACEEKAIPVAGYVDHSFAKDITATLEKLLKKSYDIKVSDIAVVGPALGEVGFGARTSVFRLKHDFLSRYYSEYANDMCFFYQKLHSGPPVRIEFPKWICDAEAVQDLARVVAAQAIIGDGYPYVLLRAHETAFLESANRDRFNTIVTWFLSEECKIPIRETVKAKMKRLSII
jgi:hypothetical protein